MKYKIGSIEFYYDEGQKVGTVTAGGKTHISKNAIELLNVFTNEIESRIRKQVQGKLEAAGINKYTGIPDNGILEESSC